MSYSKYVYMIVIFTSLMWWVAFGSNATIDIQMGSVFFASLGTALLIMIGLYEVLTKMKKLV